MRGRVAFVLVVLMGLTMGGARCAVFPRHMDPAQLAVENPGPLQLFELYGRIYGSIAVSDYAEARLLLASAEDIAAPTGTLRLISEYNRLLGSVIESLNRTEGDLADAQEQLRWLREALAEESFAASGRQLLTANVTASDLGSASRSLAVALGYSPGRLLEGLDGLNRLVGELDARILEGLEEVELVKAMRLEGTVLEMGVNETGPRVGSMISVTGSLVDSAGAGLVGRTIRFYIEGSQVGEVETGPGGGFVQSLEVPYRYVESLALWAEYWPGPEDLDLYAPSVSDTVYLSPVYSKPSLALEAPGIVYPGRGFQLRGTLSHLSRPLGGVVVIVGYLGSTLFVVSGVDGGFTLNLTTPATAGEGLAEIGVFSTPDGARGPSMTVREVQVSRVPLEVTVDEPLLVLSGWSAVIAGQVRTGGAPLPGCLIRVQVEGGVYEDRSDEDGAFSLRCATGLLALSSRRGFEVAAAPAEPWIRAEALSSEFLLINSIVAAALPVLALAAFLRWRAGQPGVGPLLMQSPVAAPVAHPELPGLPGLYLRAVGLVGRLVGVGLRPNATVREYLGAVKPVLAGSVYSIFAWVSDIYERWFYGGRGEAPLDEARSAVERLRDKVEQGTA